MKNTTSHKVGEQKKEDEVSESKNSRIFNDVKEINIEILLEQYKIYIESANLTSSLRAQANTFYLTINTVLLGFLSSVLAFLGRGFSLYWILFASGAGLLLCISWIFSLRSYRSLNSGRFTIIQKMEEKLPARIYTQEWEVVTKRRPKKSKYIRQTSVEQFIPLAFCILYIALSIVIAIL